jgi:hypothetical protein
MAAGGIVSAAMRVRPVPPLHRHRRRRRGEDAPFIPRSDLRATILRMISTHSLSAFTPAIGRADAPAQPPRAAATAAPDRVQEASAPAAAAQRSMDAVPTQPARPVPRGSLLDLRV